MKTYSSSVIRYSSEYCPAALGFHERGEPADRSIFLAGIVAHACLERCSQVSKERARDLTFEEGLEVCEVAGEDLLQRGRKYQGKQEPPLPAEAVHDGVDIARQYISIAGIQWTPTAQFEAGLGITEDGEPCEYNDPKCRYRAAYDFLDVRNEYDDHTGDSQKVVEIIDYKSAWPTNATSLDTLQSRGHAAIAYAHHPDAYRISRSMINLRTTKAFTEDLYPGHDEEHLERIERYRRRVLFSCVVADKSRDARPGYNCLACPYVLRCDDAWRPLVDSVGQNPPGETACKLFALATAVREACRMPAKEATRERPVLVDGFEVGSHRTKKMTGVYDVGAIVLAAWLDGDETDPEFRAEHGEIIALLNRLALSNSNVDRVAKSLWPRKPNDPGRLDFLKSTLTEKYGSEFGIKRADSSA